MNEHWNLRLTHLLLAALGVACRGPDDELSWNVGALREAYASPQNLPSVDGTTGSYQVFVPLGLQRFRITLGAQESLRIGKGVQVLSFGLAPPTQPYGFVSSMGNTLIGSGAQVGSVYAYGDTPLRIAAGATVHGYVKSRVPIESSRKARIDVGVQEGVAGAVEAFRWSVSPSESGLGDFSARADGVPLDLKPGAYATVVIGAGSTVRLIHGRYQMETLKLEEGGTLEVNNTQGAVYVWVRSSLILVGTMSSYTQEPNLLYGYSGSSAPRIETAFRGTLVAPAAVLSIPATRIPHRGAFYAKAIDVASGTVIEHNSFWLRHEPPVDSARLCTVCVDMTRQAIQQCCSRHRHSALRAQQAADECENRCAGRGDSTPEQCRAECDAGSPHAMHDRRVATQDCLRDAVDWHAECQASRGFNPETCSKLGYPGYGPLSCIM